MAGNNAPLTKNNFSSQGNWYTSRTFQPDQPTWWPTYGLLYLSDSLTAPFATPPFALTPLPMTDALPNPLGLLNFSGSLATVYDSNSAISLVTFQQSITTSVTFGSAPSQGDLLVAFATNNSATPGVGAGWTSVVSDSAVYDGIVVFKVCGASESTTQTPITTTNSNLVVLQFRTTKSGGFPASPIDVNSLVESTASLTPSVTTTSVTPTHATDLMIIYGWQFVAGDTPPTLLPGMATVCNMNSGTQGGPTGNGITAIQRMVGTSPYTQTITWSTGVVSKQALGIAVAITDQSNSNNYTSNQTGSLSFAGISPLNLSTLHNVTAAAQFTGPIHTQNAVLHNATASARFTGPTNLLKNISSHVSAAALSFTGAIQKATSRTLTAASLTFSGSYLWQLAKNISGALTFSGAAPVVKSLHSTLTAALNFAGSAQKATSKSLTAAALTFSGAIKKATSKGISGTLSFSGAIVKALTLHETFTAGLTFTGQYLQKNISKSVTNAALIFSGAITNKAIGKSVSGALNFVGSRVDSITYPLTAALTFSGAVSKSLSRKLTAAALTFSGSIVHLPTKVFSAALTFVGTLQKSTSKTLTGAVLHPTGSFAKTAGKTLTAALTFVGSRVDAIVYPLTAALTFVGNQSKATAKTLTSGALTFSGSVVKSTARAISGALHFTGSYRKDIAKSISAALTFAGSMSRASLYIMTAALTFAGSIIRSTAKNLTNAALTFSGHTDENYDLGFVYILNGAGQQITNAQGQPLLLYPYPIQRLFASAQFTGPTNLVKAITHGLTAALTFVSSFTAVSTHLLLLAGSLLFSGAKTAITGKNISAALSFVGPTNLLKNISYHLIAAANFAGSISKAITYPLVAASLTFAGSMTKLPTKVFTAALTFVGSRVDSILYIMNAVLTFVGSKQVSISRSLSGSLSFVGSIQKATTHLLSAALSFSGAVIGHGTHLLLLTASLTFSGPTNLLKNIAHNMSGALNFIGPTNLVKNITKTLTAAVLTFSGATTKATARALSATLSFSGSISRGIKLSTTAFTGALTFVGSRVDAIQVFLSGALSFVGPTNLVKNIVTHLVAALTFAGQVNTGTFSKILSAALTFSSNSVHNISTHLTGSLISSGTHGISVSKHIFSTLTFVGSIVKNVPKSFNGILDFTGSMSKLPTKVFVATLAPAASYLGRSIVTHLSAVLTFVAGFSTGSNSHYTQSLTGALTFVGSQGRAINTHLVAALSFVGAVSKLTTRPLAGALTLVGSYSKSVLSHLAGSLNFSSQSRHAVVTHLFAILSPVGSISRGLKQLLTGTIQNVGNLSKTTGRSLSGVLTSSGSIIRQVTKHLTAALSLVGPAIRPVIALTRNISDATLSFTTFWMRTGPEVDNFVHLEASLDFSGIISKGTLYELLASLRSQGDILKLVNKNLTAILAPIGRINRNIVMTITTIIESTKTLFSFVFNTLTGYRLISVQGASKTASVNAIFPSSFSANLAKAFINVITGKQNAVQLEFQLSVYDNTWSDYRVVLPTGTIRELMDLLPMYHNKSLANNTWSFSFSDNFGQPFTITLDSNDLTSLFSTIEFAQAGGDPGSLEGTVVITYTPISPQSDSNSEGNASPISPYDN